MVQRARQQTIIAIAHLHLQPNERRIGAIGVGQQLLVAPALDDAPAGNDGNRVGVADRRQPVRDDDRRAALAERVERGLHGALRGGVERRGRLVKEEHARVFQHGARDRDPLLLAAAQLHAALAHGGVVPLRQRRDERVRVGGARGRLDVGARRAAGAAHRDVLKDRRHEERRLLRHEADLFDCCRCCL